MRKWSRVYFGLVVVLMCVSNIVPGQNADSSKASAEKLVYADFEKLENGRLVSSRGGRTQLNRWAQNMGAAPKVRGLENAEPPTPAPAPWQRCLRSPRPTPTRTPSASTWKCPTPTPPMCSSPETPTGTGDSVASRTYICVLAIGRPIGTDPSSRSEDRGCRRRS